MVVENGRAKLHLDNVISVLANVDNPHSAASLINKTSLDLLNNLSDNNLFIDNEIITGLEAIVNDLNNGAIGTRVHDQISLLERERTALLTGGIAGGAGGGGGGSPFSSRISEIGNKLTALIMIADTGGNISTITTNRHNEFNNLLTHSQYFNLGTTLPNPNINVATTPITGTNINLANFLNTTGTPPTPTYLLCDENGNEIAHTGGNYKIQIGGTEYTLGNINFTGNNLDLTHITINPRITNLPQTLNLSITARYPVAMGARTINVACNKKFKLTLNDGTISVDSEASRANAFDDYETSGGRHAISQQLNTKINIRNTDPEVGKNVLERKAIESALKYKGGTKYDTLSDKQKRLFYERVCRAGFFTPVYTGGGVIDTGTARYDKMKAWFVDGNRPRNKDKNNIKSAGDYKTFIHSHLDEKCDEYILDTLQNYLQEDVRNTALKAELSRFLQEVDNNKLDNDHVNTDIHRDLNHKKYKMNKGPVSLFHPRDVNYMRFLSRSSTSLKDQKVNIYSNIDNPEPVEYDMNLSVSGKNNIEVEIKIKGTDEVIKQKSSQPATLVRKIMRDTRIKHGKVRAHIGFNIYKSVIRMAQDKDISLTYRGMEGKMRGNRLHKSRETRKIILDQHGNIIIKQIDHLTTTNSEKDIFVFDQDSFLNVNEFDNGQTNGRLREGLETLGYHFNMAMNHLHKQYRKATERRICKILPSKNRMRLPTSFWLSPIKKILNAKTTTNFDFNTTVNSLGKNIEIDFHKNKFTIKMDGLKELSGRDLGNLLNHREGRVRVFDGMERDIVEGVYSCLVDNLRKNAKVARSSFGVKDDITGNMYIIDEDGQFGVIAREDFKGKNKVKNPIRGRFRGSKKSGALKKKRLDEVSWRPLEASEKRELLKNPFLMQKLVKSMNRRMGLRGSISAMF